MKKKILLTTIFLFILLVAVYTVSNAATYETDSFKVNIPDRFKVETFQNELEAENEDGSIGISIGSTPNNGTTIDPNKEFLDYMIQYFKERYGSNFSVISSKLLETNGCKGLEIQFRDKDYNIYYYYYYGDLHAYYSDNYTYSIVIISMDRNYLTSAERNGIVNSFKVKDTVKVTNGIPFMDVKKSDWYYDSVKYVSSNKIITGTTDYTYNPSGKLTRGMLATILWRMEGMPKATKGINFPDVKTTDWYYEAIKWAYANKIVSGYSTGKFGPKDNVTREQLAVMLNNYATYKKKDTSKVADISKFADVKGISSYAKNAVAWAVKNNIISGKSNGTRIDPKGNATRAGAAAMIQNYRTYVK